MRLRYIMISNVSSSKLTARPATAMAEKDRIAPTIHAAARSVSLPAGVAAEGVGVTSAMT